jgi:DNA-binding CsgD family transcriptional regulator
MEVAKNNILLTSQSDISSICSPLFAVSPLNYFAYCNVYPDGSYYMLSTHADWHKHIYETQIYKNERITLIQGQNREHIIPWDSCWPLRAAHASEFFKLNHCITIGKKTENNYELVCFGTDKKPNNIMNYYFNNMDILKKFIFYFKEKAIKLIQTANTQPNKLLLATYSKEFTQKGVFNNKGNYYKDARNIFKTNKYFFDTNIKKGYLTRRELECLLLTLEGKTLKEVGFLLNISLKSVDSYLTIVKEKLGCHNRSQLFRKAAEAGFTNLLE